MRWAIFENTVHKTREAYLYFEDADDDYPILRASAVLFPDPGDDSAFPCVVSGCGVVRRFSDNFRGFDNESAFVGFEEVRPVDGTSSIASAADAAYPLSFSSIYPKNVKRTRHGWLSPNGDTYSCLPDAHADMAYAIIEEFGYRDDFQDFQTRTNRAIPTPAYDFLLDIGWAMLNPTDEIYQDVAHLIDPSEVPALFTTTVTDEQADKLRELDMWTFMVEKRARWFEDSPPF